MLALAWGSDAPARRVLRVLPPVFAVILLLLAAGCDELRGMDGSPQAGSAATAIPVRQAQAGLTALGYAVGPVDGVLGPRTAAAITRFREREGMRRAAPPEAGIDTVFADRLAERLAFEGLEWRRRARRAAQAERARARTPEPPPTPEGERDDVLEDLLSRYESGAAPAQ
ncbi:MAG: peptidoglycan-binding domain-containing protein [Pseudomonadota bacterium]